MESGMFCSRRGDIGLPMLLGLLLGVALIGIMFFFFQEYFTSTDISDDVCHQSVLLRGNIREATVAGITLTEFKDSYPLKCKTRVVSIDFEDEERASQMVANTIASCWYQFGQGEYDIFPKKFFGSTTCVPCARIHIESSVAEYYATNPIDVYEGLRGSFKGSTFIDYLNNRESNFGAFTFGNARMFNLNSEQFTIDSLDSQSSFFSNPTTGGNNKPFLGTVNYYRVDLPRFFDGTSGDLLVFYGSLDSHELSDVGTFVPYLFYMESNQATSEMFSRNLFDFVGNDYPLCSAFAGVAA